VTSSLNAAFETAI